MKIPIVLHLLSRTNTVYIHRDPFNHRWIFWLGSAKDFSEGEAITIHDDGSMYRIRLHAAGYEEELMKIKPPDSKQGEGR